MIGFEMSDPGKMGRLVEMMMEGHDPDEIAKELGVKVVTTPEPEPELAKARGDDSARPGSEYGARSMPKPRAPLGDVDIAALGDALATMRQQVEWTRQQVERGHLPAASHRLDMLEAYGGACAISHDLANGLRIMAKVADPGADRVRGDLTWALAQMQDFTLLFRALAVAIVDGPEEVAEEIARSLGRMFDGQHGAPETMAAFQLIVDANAHALTKGGHKPMGGSPNRKAAAHAAIAAIVEAMIRRAGND